LFVSGIPCHVILRGNDRQIVFKGDGDRLSFLGYLRDGAVLNGLAIHSYVLMDNHVHLLVTGEAPRSIALAMQSLGRKYVPRFNRLNARTGTLWEGRYRSTLVQAERYALHCQRYIELNPVRAGMASAPVEFCWSSHLHYGWGKPDDLLTPLNVYEALGCNDHERQIAYRRLFDVPISDAVLDEIRDASNNGWALGSEPFAEAMERLTGRRARPASKGPKRMEKDPAGLAVRRNGV